MNPQRAKQRPQTHCCHNQDRAIENATEWLFGQPRRSGKVLPGSLNNPKKPRRKQRAQHDDSNGINRDGFGDSQYQDED
jgi:hypothetical protein